MSKFVAGINLKQITVDRLYSVVKIEDEGISIIDNNNIPHRFRLGIYKWDVIIPSPEQKLVFQPVTLTLETPQEVEYMRALMGASCNSIKEAYYVSIVQAYDVYCELDGVVDKEGWVKLRGFKPLVIRESY